LLVASSEWKGRRLQEILEKERILDFYDSDETTTRYLKHYQLKSENKRGRIFINENEALIRMFSAGVGFGTLTESIAAPLIEDGTLISLNRGQTLEDPLALAWYPRPRKMDYFEDLIRAIK
jgi:DNA-binding transcriptional LysR family regulator